MKHYWINVDKNEKRRKFMETQFKSLGLQNHRISAITPEDFDFLLAHQRPLTCKYPGCTSCEYEYACISSHIKALRACINTTPKDPDNPNEWFVIMEDDVYLPFDIDYKQLISNAPEDAELIQTLILYGPTVKHLYQFNKKGMQFIKWQYLLPSTGMYLISRRGAEKLVSMYFKNDKYDFSCSPYQVVADVTLYASINSYATTFPYTYPYIEMGSEIHPDHLTAHSSAVKDIKEVIDDAVQTRHLPYIRKYIAESSYEKL
jgi:GR25 family glycosyltransferase involved in LPS biosynthesis